MENKTKKYKIIVFALFLIILILLVNFVSQFIVIDRRELYTSVVVTDNKLGFDLNSTALTFGTALVGKSTSRGISIENNFKSNSRVNIKSTGNISDFLIVSENNFILNSGEKKDLNFIVAPPKGTPLGKYEGTITITSRYSFFRGRK